MHGDSVEQQGDILRLNVFVWSFVIVGVVDQPPSAQSESRVTPGQQVAVIHVIHVDTNKVQY